MSKESQGRLRKKQQAARRIDIHDEDVMYRMALLHSQAGSIIGWKDLNSRFLWASQVAAVMSGYQHAEDFIGQGIMDQDVRCGASELADQFMLEDQKVISTCKPLRSLTYSCCAGNTWHALLIQKYPICDAQGVMFAMGQSVQDITDTPLALMNYRFLQTQSNMKGTEPAQFSCVLDDLLDGVSFSSQQKAVIFYLLRGHTAKGIAQRIGKNERTVQDYLNALRMQFGCDSKAQLHEKLMALGYVQLLPSSCLVAD